MYLELMGKMKEQAALYLELTQAQAEIIENAEEKRLELNLKNRRAAMDELDRLRAELDGLEPGEQALQGADIREEIVALLSKAQALEQENKAQLEKQLTFFKSEIRRLSASRKGLKQYHTSGVIFDAELFDKKQ